MDLIYLKKQLRNIVSEEKYDAIRLAYRLSKFKLHLPDDNDYIVQFQKKIIQPDNVVFDIGSNKGFFTYHYLNIVKNGFVYSFEPIKRTFRLQQKFLQRFSSKNYHLDNIAFSNSEGEIEFVMPKNGNYANDTCAAISTEGTCEHFSEKEIIKIACLKVDSFIEKEKINRVDFVKIDVEGAELLVFQGAEKLLKMQPIIFAELLERHFEKFRYTTKDIISFLKSYTYKPFFFSKKDAALVPEANNRNSDYSDCYFIPAAREPELILKGIILG